MKKKRTKRRSGLPLFLLFLFSAALVALYFINHTFKIAEYSLEYADLPKSFDGFKIVLISDLHDREFSEDNYALIEKIKSQNPDIIALSGDMHDKNSNTHEIFLAFLLKLAEISPVYYAFGNHEEIFSSDEKWIEYMENIKNSDINLINGNDSYKFFIDEDYISISGVNWHYYPETQPIFDENAFNIHIIHDPMAFDTVENQPQLMLSGHIHGGIIHIPFVGGLFSPGASKAVSVRAEKNLFDYLFPKYSSGVYENGENRLVVSTGLGFSIIPIRFMRAEITVITLKTSK